MHDARRRSSEAARFLRERRSRLSPTAAELRAQPHRRVPGLTREEVAARAGVSLTWYSWLEMGRDIRATSSTLASIARALQLNPDETSYLLTLAGAPLPGGFHPVSELGDAILANLVDGFGDSPAFVVDRSWNVVTSNKHARALYGFVPSTDVQQNILWRLVRDATLRSMHADPDGMMASVAAIVRFNFADDPDNADLAKLVAALNENDRFREAWASYSVHSFEPLTVLVRSKDWTLSFLFVALAVGHLGRETLVLHMPLDDRTRDALAD